MLGKEKSQSPNVFYNLEGLNIEQLNMDNFEVFSELQRLDSENVISNAKKVFENEEFKTILCDNQFIALSHQMYRSEDLSPLTRILISSEIASNLQKYEQMYKSMYQNKGSIHSYLYDLSQPNTLNGDQLSLQAASNCYNAEIILLNEDKIVKVFTLLFVISFSVFEISLCIISKH